MYICAMTHNIRHTILYALLGVFLFSCYSNDRNRLAVLQKADSLMQQYPDSALSLLEDLGRTDTLTNADKAYYALLYTQARDKNYLMHTTDSLIRWAVDYYDSQEDAAMQMKSHYYLARVYQDMDSVAASVREFVVAKQGAEEAKDSVFLYLCCSNLGYLLKNQDLLDEADVFYKQAEEIAVLEHDSFNLASILINQGEIFIMRGERFYSQAEEKLLSALNILHARSNIQVKRFAVSTLASLYSNMERYDDVIHWERIYLTLQPDSLNRFGSYLDLGDAFYQLNQTDSAFYYLFKSALSPYYYTKSGAYGILSKVAEREGLLSESLQWKDSCLLYTNLSASIPQSVEAIASLKDAINYQLIKRYEYHTHRQWHTAILIIVILLVIFLGLFLWHVHRHKLSKIEFEQKLKTSAAECEQSYAQVLTLNKRLEDVEAARDELLRKQIHELPVYPKIVSLLDKNKDLDVIKELIDTKLWDEIISELDTLTGGFTTRLSSEYPNLKKPDIRFCCLLKMGFKYSEIGCLLGRTSSMMYKRCGIIANRMGLRDKSLLMDFIKSLR